jgi:hypothetical protein
LQHSDTPVKRPARRHAPPARSAARTDGAEPAGPLGIPTKYSAQKTRELVDADTGEILTIQELTARDGSKTVRAAYDQDAVDLERWMMKAHARKLLMKVEIRDKKVKVPYTEIAPYSDLVTRQRRYAPVADRFRMEVMPDKDGNAIQKKAVVYRVVNCTRSKIRNDVQPELWHSKVSDRAAFHKVQLCGSVWTCPTCSRKINLGRQAQIQRAYDLFQQAKASDVLMVTFTVPHGWSDKTADTLAMLKEADGGYLQKSWGYRTVMGYSRTVKGVKVRVPSTLDYVGRISATEITYGKNGAHPHLHQLWFFDRRLKAAEVEALRALLFKEWKAACVAVGLPAPVEFAPPPRPGARGKPLGVDVRRALSAAEYLSKFGSERTWGPEKEMASAHAKKSTKGRTPFQLLFDSAQGDAAAGDLFRDFAAATLGRHQLEFSHSLRRRLEELGVDDLDASDIELAQQLADESTRLGQLTDAEFEALCNLRPQDLPVEPFGTVLAVCKAAGFDAALDWIRQLPTYFDLSMSCNGPPRTTAPPAS